LSLETAVGRVVGVVGQSLGSRNKNTNTEDNGEDSRLRGLSTCCSDSDNIV
jgi:hypothetical protein